MSDRLCEKCSSLTLTEVVSCSGRCQRSFHRACATRTEDAENGWFCDGCRRELAGKAVGDSDGLPTEVLAHILQYLNCEELQRARRVCHRWRDVVDGTPALVGRMKIFIRAVMDRGFKPQHLIASRNVDIRESVIASVDHWWPELGVRLVRLNLYWCRMDFSTFYALLGQTPQLEHLLITECFMIGRIEQFPRSDHRLTKLKEIIIRNTESKPPFSRALGVTKFAQLKIFMFRQGHLGAFDEVQDAIDIICSAQDTLEDLNLASNKRSMIRTLNNLPRLNLKRVSLGSIEEFPLMCRLDDWSVFLRTQASTLEDLQIGFAMRCEELPLIGSCCPRLNRISLIVTTMAPGSIILLDNIPQLQCLNFSVVSCGYSASINFESCSTPDLKEFILRDCECQGISQYLSKSSSIQKIRLQFCSMDNWTDFLSGIEQCNETLQDLTIAGNGPDPSVFHITTKTFHKLTHLHISVHDYPKQPILSLLEFCPQLEVVKFVSVKSLDDEVILMLLSRAKKLRELTVDRCGRVTKKSAKHVYLHCSNLKQLAMDGVQIPAELLALLKDRHITVLN